MLELKSMMRVNVAWRPETFVVLMLTADPKFVYLLNETTGDGESVKIADVLSVVDQDVRVPKLPVDVLIEHLNDVGFNDEDHDVYALISEAMICPSRVRDYFQTMVDAVDYDALVEKVQSK